MKRLLKWAGIAASVVIGIILIACLSLYYLFRNYKLQPADYAAADYAVYLTKGMVQGKTITVIKVVSGFQDKVCRIAFTEDNLHFADTISDASSKLGYVVYTTKFDPLKMAYDDKCVYGIDQCQVKSISLKSPHYTIVYGRENKVSCDIPKVTGAK